MQVFSSSYSSEWLASKMYLRLLGFFYLASLPSLSPSCVLKTQRKEKENMKKEYPLVNIAACK
jgi:hypothetical protein